MTEHLADRLLFALCWGSLALCSMTATSCLLPQNDPILPDVPPTRNRPPYFVEGLLIPAAGRFTITSNGGIGGTDPCTIPLSFSATAADPDINDLLVAEWYVDFDLQPVGALVEQQAIQNPTGEEIRVDPASWSTTPGSPGSPLNQPATHVVDLLVSDGQLINRVPQPRSIAGSDGGFDPTYVIKNTWVVDVSCP